MIADDGAPLDSRQAVDGDRLSEVTLRSLAASILWWRTAVSVVMPLLKSLGPEAFAIVIGNRSLIEVRPDGSTHRTGLRSILPGGITSVELVRSGMHEKLSKDYEEAEILRNRDKAYMGTVGFKRGERRKRWQFLNGSEYYLSQAGRKIGPSVVVDTTPWVVFDESFAAARFGALEHSRLFAKSIVLVVPHTFGAETFFRRYVEWVRVLARHLRPPWSAHRSPRVSCEAVALASCQPTHSQGRPLAGSATGSSLRRGQAPSRVYPESETIQDSSSPAAHPS
jgi:hypothetical protein